MLQHAVCSNENLIYPGEQDIAHFSITGVLKLKLTFCRNINVH